MTKGLQSEGKCGIMISVYKLYRFGSDIMGKVNFEVNSSAEKIILAGAASVALAILFDGKKKKPQKRKSFVQRVSRNYKMIDNALTKTVAKNVAAKEKEKLLDEQFKTKLRHLEIEGSEPIDAEVLYD